MKILIIGHAGHGKDKLAELLSKHHNLTFESSSEYCCEKLIYPKIKDEFNYESPAECFYLRDECRDLWKTIIADYNTPDRSRLAREILATNDIYVGMRSNQEYQASCDFFDHIFYVDAYHRHGHDATMSIPFDPSRMTYVENNGTIEDLDILAGKLI